MTMTNSLKEMMACLALVIIFCACVMTYPATLNENSRLGDLKTLIEQIRNELNLNDNSNVKNDIGLSDLDLNNRNAMHPGTGSRYDSLNMIQTQDSQSKPLISSLLLKNDENPTTFDVKKRQGAWDYDYGLGGGRFGKRAGYWADYSLGGGRFGRDVDHVSNMADSEESDFEDTE